MAMPFLGKHDFHRLGKSAADVLRSLRCVWYSAVKAENRGFAKSDAGFGTADHRLPGHAASYAAANNHRPRTMQYAAVIPHHNISGSMMGEDPAWLAGKAVSWPAKT